MAQQPQQLQQLQQPIAHAQPEIMVNVVFQGQRQIYDVASARALRDALAEALHAIEETKKPAPKVAAKKPAARKTPRTPKKSRTSN